MIQPLTSLTGRVLTLADKGTKAMYGILKRGEFHNLSISCQLDLFDKVVKPILLYGCELWGLSNLFFILLLFEYFFLLN
jgi:hypothetical protein